jgi:hypothetical protein
MKRPDFLKELQKLTPPERLAVIEAALQQFLPVGAGLKPAPTARRRRWPPPPKPCKGIYAPGGELTAFTALDMPERECGPRD